jgi:uncharacterized membrane protein HdeD (DUF308 family)
MEVSNMSTTIERPDLAKLRQELAAFRRNCLWFVLLGMALIIVGFIAFGSLVLASRATMTAIGAQTRVTQKMAR